MEFAASIKPTALRTTRLLKLPVLEELAAAEMREALLVEIVQAGPIFDRNFGIRSQVPALTFACMYDAILGRTKKFAVQQMNVPLGR